MKKNDTYLLKTYRNDVLLKRETLIFTNSFENKSKKTYYRFISLTNKDIVHFISEEDLLEYAYMPEKDKSIIYRRVLTKN